MPPLAQTQVHPTDPLSEVVRRYGRHGFPERFAARPGGNVHCEACERDNPALWVRLLALHRLEGDGPKGEVAVAAVECPACEERGTLALSFGPFASVEDRLVLSLLDDRREETVLDIGLRVGI